ncbi:hypothetical protein D046_2614B, partial [Vibrio parahaemolyticus V-223/04]
NLPRLQRLMGYRSS